MNWHNRLHAYAHLMRLHRPIGSFLLLWPTLWALWLAGAGFPSPRLVFLFVVGVFLMRGLGCVMNDIADRKFDGFVTRTRDRPLVTGALSLTEATGLLGLLSLLALGLVLQLNRLTLELACVGFVLTCLYPYSKRFTHWPQCVLGLVWSWGIPMAFAAQTNQVPGIAWFLVLSVSLWVLAYDTMYAIMDRDDDRHIGIKSTALFWGHRDRLFIALVQLGFMISLVSIACLLKLHYFFYGGLCVAGGLLVYQQYLIKDRKPERCFKAFCNNTWVGASVFLAFLLGLRPELVG